MKKAKDPSISKPGLVILTSPGFNVDEWIDAVDLPLPMVIVNGDLDRLRNGYYPSLFYPKLAKVTKSFYKNVQQVYYLSAVAAAGDRFKGSFVFSEPCQTCLGEGLQTFQILISSAGVEKTTYKKCKVN